MSSLLDADRDDTIRLSIDTATALGRDALVSLGFDDGDARVTADHLVDAAAWGLQFAGLPRVLVISERPELRLPTRPISLVKETPTSAVLDGGNHIGYVSVQRAVDLAIEKVRVSGMAIVTLRNSWFGGRAGYYLERIARAGYGAIYCVSSNPTVVPPGSARKALGTNPIAIALPGAPNPFLFDMGTAAAMSGEVLMRAMLGREFDDVVGIDGNGIPTRSAADLLEGGVFPFGGHKGYGLSLAVQALGLLAGAKQRNGQVADFGYFLVAFDPELFMPLSQFTDELEELLSELRRLPLQDGASPVRIPSERGFREREIRREQGILLDRTIHDRLSAIRDRRFKPDVGDYRHDRTVPLDGRKGTR